MNAEIDSVSRNLDVASAQPSPRTGIMKNGNLRTTAFKNTHTAQRRERERESESDGLIFLWCS